MERKELLQKMETDGGEDPEQYEECLVEIASQLKKMMKEKNILKRMKGRKQELNQEEKKIEQKEKKEEKEQKNVKEKRRQ